MTRTGGIILAVALLAAGLRGPASADEAAGFLMYVRPLSPAAIENVQQALAANRTFHGNANGVWDADSANALSQFQQLHGIRPTGQLNDATAAALGLDPSALLAATAPASAPAATPAIPVAGTALTTQDVRDLKFRLWVLGDYQGPLDGRWDAAAADAVARFQRDAKMPVTGQLDPRTVTAMGLNPQNLANASR